MRWAGVEKIQRTTNNAISTLLSYSLAQTLSSTLHCASTPPRPSRPVMVPGMAFLVPHYLSERLYTRNASIHDPRTSRLPRKHTLNTGCLLYDYDSSSYTLKKGRIRSGHDQNGRYFNAKIQMGLLQTFSTAIRWGILWCKIS